MYPSSSRIHLPIPIQSSSGKSLRSRGRFDSISFISKHQIHSKWLAERARSKMAREASRGNGFWMVWFGGRNRRMEGWRGYIDEANPTSGKVTPAGKLECRKGCDVASLKECDIASLRICEAVHGASRRGGLGRRGLAGTTPWP